MEALYGRAQILDEARASVGRALAGTGRPLLFTGEPGIGKSALTEYVAAEAAGRQAAVAWGRCWEAGGAPPYWPWIQVFRGLGMDDDPFAGATAGIAGGATEARFAAFDRAVRALKTRAERSPLALVLDDLHAADAPSLLLLLLLARQLRGSPILVVGAYRDAEARLTPELAPLLAKIARESQVLPLPRLGAEDVAVWAQEEGGRAHAEAAELYRLTEGHPLFLVEALRLGRGRAELPVGLGAVLDEHLARLTASTRAVLEIAAVLGRDFSPADVAAIAGTGPDSVHQALTEAMATSVVQPTAEPARFRFSHVLLRDRIYSEVLPSTRARLHFGAATVALAEGAPALAAAVHHLFEGQSAASPERVAEGALAAAEASLSRLAFEDTARVARRALALGEAAPLPESLQDQLLLVLAEALIRLGESAEGKALCVRVAEAADRAGAPDWLARAALVYSTDLASGILDPQMIALLRGALASFDDQDSLVRARLMARLAAALTPPAGPEMMSEILGLMRSATAMARRMGDRHTLLYVLQFAATVALMVPEDERFSIMQETMELATALDERLVLLQAFPAYITALLGLGQRAEAEAILPRYDELVVDARLPIHRIQGTVVHALLCTIRGDFAEADRLGAEAREAAERAGSGPGMRLWLTHRMALAILRGAPEMLGPEVAPLVTHFEHMWSGLPLAAFALLGAGRRAEAAARLRSLDLAALSIPSANLIELLGAADVCVQLEEVEIARTIYPRLLRAADWMLCNLAPGSLMGPTARTLGNLALLIGQPAAAVRHQDEAIACAEKLGATWLVEMCQRAREAALLRASGQTGPLPHPASALAPGESAPVPAPVPLQLRREGDVWALTAPAGAGRLANTVRLKHMKGVGYLHYLIEQAGRQVHVLELVGVDLPVGDAGPLLDAQAKRQYQQRLDDLRDQLAEAEGFGDVGRAGRIEGEIGAIADQLAGAVGLGGRDRRAASAVERTRINVQRCLKDAIDRVAALDPALGRYLAAAVKSGTYCAFIPI